ncbi:MAG TPA: hypothetical protein PK971_06960 [Saprospiraceae bacterium]|nr:hypothetical protein [Saprospiraceae bacterium]
MRWTLLWLLLLPLLSTAQEPIYRGQRISLFAFETVKQAPKSITLRCHVANTGRHPIAYGKAQPPPPALVIEMDTQAVPTVLRGREQVISAAMRQEKVSLAPGQVKKKWEIKINLENTRPDTAAPAAEPSRTACADLVFDTVYITHYSEKKMEVEYVLRNQGSKPAQLLGNSPSRTDNLALNVYFSGSLRLTRGAILADGDFLREGRETLDGILLPGQQLRGSLSFSLKHRTRFSPHLLFEIDPFQAVPECDKANNVWAMQVEF